MTSPVARALAETRFNLGLSQESLGLLVGCSQKYLSGLENSIKQPTREFIQKIIDVLELGEVEQHRLWNALRMSQRKYEMSSDAPEEAYLLMNELWQKVEDMSPNQLMCIRTMVAEFTKMEMANSLPKKILQIRRKRKEMAEI